MKKVCFALLTGFCLLQGKQITAQCVTYDVHACIDVIDYLHVQGNQMWWVHQGGSNPGQHSSCSGDKLSVNGTPWGNWSTPFTLSGVTTCMSVTSSVTQCSNSCSLVQSPDANNSWETIYKFDDSGPSAAHNYKIVFTFCPATPTSEFTVSTPACVGNNVTITYTGNGSGAATYNWNFGGATVISGSGQGPYVVQWNTPGNYNVTLDVTECSTSPVTTVPVQVAVSPTSDFTVSSPVCEDSTSTITYTGTGTAGATYNWDFDGGTVISGTGQGPHTVKWNTAGTKNITLQVNESGCLSPVTTETVTVIAPQTSAFTTSAPVCMFNVATITYTGSASPSANYTWGFDGGTVISGSGQGPYTVSWTIPGTKNITLTVTENNCPSAITTVQQEVVPLPVADFLFTEVCLGNALPFTDATSVSSISTWSWDFGDSSPPDATQNPAHNYTNAGSYNVALIATDNNGCKDTITKSVTVHALPDVSFNATNVCDGTPAQFSNTSTVAPPDIVQFSAWSFGDGNISTITNPAHLYASNGSYTVKLVITSDFGCMDSLSKTIIVNPNPAVNFMATDTNGCHPLCISFQDLTAGNNSQWLWVLGDGSTVNNSQSFEHCFTNDTAAGGSIFNPVYYSPNLTVTSDSGCVSTLTKNNYITVYPEPIASFTPNPEISLYTDAVITLTNNSIGATTWKWDFGDMQTDVANTPTPHFYSDTGSYVIQLIVSNQYLCADTIRKTIMIEPDFVFHIPNAFTPDGDGLNETFSGTGTFITTYNMKIFDRWGNLIYQTDDIAKAWDGKANNGKELAQMDTYVYSIEITDVKNRQHQYKGTVSLIR